MFTLEQVFTGITFRESEHDTNGNKEKLIRKFLIPNNRLWTHKGW